MPCLSLKTSGYGASSTKLQLFTIFNKRMPANHLGHLNKTEINLYRKLLPKLILFVLAALLGTISAFANGNVGHYFLRHYSPSLINVDNQNYDIAQDHNGVLCFANRKGVLKFNGGDWYIIQTPSSALKLKLSPQDKHLYVGCSNDFGYITQNIQGIDHYVSLSDSLDVEGDITHIQIVGNWVYFLTENQLFEYSSIEHRITNQFKADKNNAFFSLIPHGKEMLVFSEDQQLYRVRSNTLHPMTTEVPDGNWPVFSLPVSSKQSLVGVAEGEIYKLEEDQFTTLELEDHDFLKNHNLLDGLVFQDSLLVLSTLSAGVVVVNWQTGSTVSKINYDTGLPDNEIFALFKDQQNNLWIAHDYGVSVLDFHSPIQVYSGFYGLKGGILSVGQSENRLYVGTSVGLFYFDRVVDVKEIEKLVREQKKQEEERTLFINNKAPKKSNKNKIAKKDDNTTKEVKDESKKSSWIKRLFSKRDKKKKGRKKKNKDDTEDDLSKNIEEEEDTPKEIEDIPVKEEVSTKNTPVRKKKNNISYRES